MCVPRGSHKAALQQGQAHCTGAARRDVASRGEAEEEVAVLPDGVINVKANAK